jgi:hypothetical protein
MTEDLNRRLPPDQFTSSSSDSAQLVTLNLPANLARLIQTRSQQLGQSDAEVILTLLQSALCTANPDNAEQTTAPDATTLKSLQTRLTALEAMIPRLVQLEGKWMAF